MDTRIAHLQASGRRMVTSGALERALTRATVYLRTSLFTFAAGERHVPSGVSAVEGELELIGNGGVTVQVETWKDERGRVLEAPSRKLFVPMSKVDHVDIQES